MTTTRPEAIPHYPLEWPLGWKRCRVRRHGQFKTVTSETTATGTYKRGRPISMQDATRRLEIELDKLGVVESTLSTNVRLTLSGRPRGDENPGDPGAAIYFVYKKKPTVLACDTYWRLPDNIAALAAHLEALRAIERYGVGTIEQALAGYKALPADTAADWRSVFGFAQAGYVSRDQLDTAYKALAREKHPDVTHDDGAAMAHLNRARDYALQELG